MWGRGLSALLCATTLCAGLGATPAAAAPRTTVATTCFTATGPDGKPYKVFGRRYSTGRPAATTPAIVLVHGVASTSRIWDLTPKASVARRLAAAGYVVLAYDRLGYGRSPYAGAPAALTVAAQQAVLHDVVGQLHRRAYRVGGCAAKTTTYASRRVVVVGHSGGGFIVSSYPGRYHDVVAMVQANAPSGIPSTSPAGNAAIVSATAPAAHGARDDVLGPIGDASHDGAAPTPVEGYDYAPGPARAPCEEFDLWRAGADPAAATVLCDPAHAQGTPTGETGSYAVQALQVNPGLIARTGKIPVLLAGADHDGIMPGDANALELSGWREHCGCDVGQFILKSTGHAFMAHQSLPTWVANVTRWLKAQHITPARRAGKGRTHHDL